MVPHRRLVVAALVAASTLVAAELAARALAPAVALSPQWPDQATAVKTAQLAAQPCTDVVFVGNSMARDGLDPEVWGTRDGRRAYNAALDAAGVEQVGAWLEDRVVPALDPAVVVWAIASPDLDPTAPAGAAAGEAYLTSPGGRRDLTGRWQRQLWDRLALIRHREALADPGEVVDALGDRLAGRRALRTGVEGLAGVLGAQGQGLSRRDLHYRPGDPVATTFVAEQLLGQGRPSPSSVEAAATVVRSLQEDDRQVVLVTMPVTAEFVTLHPDGPGDWEAYRAAMNQLSDTTGATLVDLDSLEHLVALDESEIFADTHHLNAAGAAAATEALVEALARQPRATSHCGASA